MSVAEANNLTTPSLRLDGLVALASGAGRGIGRGVALSLAEAGADMILYPLSAFRAMNQAALKVYQSIREQGHQKDVVDIMQTRMELYDFLNYHDYEQKLDALFAKGKG